MWHVSCQYRCLCVCVVPCRANAMSVFVCVPAAEEQRNEENADLNEEMTWSKVGPLHLQRV